MVTVIVRNLSAKIDKIPNIVPDFPKKSQEEIISPSDVRTVRDKYVMMRSFAMNRSNSSSLCVRRNCPTIVCRFQELSFLP